MSVTSPCSLRRLGRGVLAAWTLLLGCLFPTTLRAHPLDENNVYHFQACRLTREKLTLDFRVVIGGLVANRGWPLLDTDGDQTLSEAERDAFAATLQHGVQILLDGSELTPRLVRQQFPSHEEFFAGQFAYIQVVLEAPLPADLAAGPHDVKLVDRNLTDFSGVFPRALVSAPDEFQATLPTTPDDGRTSTFSFLLPDPKAVKAAGAHPAATAGTRAAPAASRTAKAQSGSAHAAVPSTTPGAASRPTPASTATAGGAETRAREGAPRAAGRSETTSASVPSPDTSTAPVASKPASGLPEPQLKLELPPGLAPVPPEKRGVIALAPAETLRLPSSEAPALSSILPTAPSPASTPARAPLKDALRGSLSLGGLLLALGTALLLGMGHALTPGHGKSVVAAYLVGSRGTVWDAVFLGAVVTLTHTGSVLLLGLALLLASHYVLPETVFPWLGFASGAIIVGMGFWMLVRGILAWYGVVEPHSHSHGPGHTHTHSHGVLGGTRVHTHDDAHVHNHTSAAGHSHTERGHGPTHSYSYSYTHDEGHSHAPDDEHAEAHAHHHAAAQGHGHAASHSHPHPHSHEHGHGHSHSQPHSHGHPHSHDHAHSHGHDHVIAHSGRPSRWGLLGLGMAGGMVPCPDAIVVLLAAVSLNKILLGLGLIVAFSLGLASVLIGIGILMVTAGGWMQRWSGEGRVIRLLPAVSGAAILVLGFVIAVQSLVSGHVIRFGG